jgi:PKD repeat protein
MKRSIVYLSMLLVFCVGCKRVEVDFSYEPTTPRAGQTIAFTNLCTEGEDWLWTFGDNSVSTLKNPRKAYKKPGTYIVTLMVDSAKYNTRSKEITVYDTIPTFVCSTDSILHYQDVTFTANIYNPFNYQLTYEWTLPNNCVIASGSLSSKAITVFFTSPLEDTVQLKIAQKDSLHTIKKAVTVHLTQAPAIVMQVTEKIVRQRIINDRIEDPKPAIESDTQLIKASPDTVVTFNGTTFYASSISSTIAGFSGMDIQHLQIDAMTQKWYITTPDGLFVTNFDGSAQVLIDATATGPIFVDTNRNRLYWATASGLKSMPLVKSKNNQFTSTAVNYNLLDNITLIAVDNNLR